MWLAFLLVIITFEMMKATNSTIKCADDQNCVINCGTVQGCSDISHIDASTANSLTLNCTSIDSEGCSNTNISCPIGDNTSCNIYCFAQWSCHHALIKAGNDNIMNDLSLHCIGTASCETASILLRASEINNMTINCNGERGCAQLSLISDNVNNNIIDSLSLLCDGRTSCSNLEITNDNNVTIGELDIDCTDVNSCGGIKFAVNIDGNVDINCSYAESCTYTNITLLSISTDVNINIECFTHSNDTWYDQKACYRGAYYIHGYVDDMDNQFNNISFSCGSKDCVFAQLFTHNVHNVSIGCDGPYSCRYAIIDAATATYLDLDCMDQYSCAQTIVYCPYKDVNSCSVDCSDLGSSCTEMSIRVSDAYIYGYLDINCPSNSDSCSYLEIQCTDNSKQMVTFGENEYSCSGSSHCCPYFNTDKIITCDVNTDCDIICDSIGNDCGSSWINGMDSNYLTVDCIGDNQCQNATIHCPVNGCSIECTSQYSCENIKIYYDGLTRHNGIISIKCKGNYGCHSGLIYAENINEINIDCIGSVDGVNQYVCSAITLNVPHSNMVYINANLSYAVYDNYFNINNAKYVSINANGKYSFSGNDIYVSNARSLTMTCSSDEGTACENDIHAPYNTIYNCFGYGCASLGTMYLYGSNASSTEGIQINIDYCGQCSNVDECIGEFTLECNYDGYGFVNTQSCQNIVSGSDCGCTQLISNTQLISKSDPNQETKCYSSYHNAIYCGDNEQCDVECFNSNTCANNLIDGRNADYLSVFCTKNYFCEYAIIQCPANGCKIVCDGEYSCQYMEISYYGHNDDLGQIYVECAADHSCDDMTTNAKNINAIDISCIENTINHANWKVDNATSVVVNARGGGAFQNSNMFAANAASFTAICSSDDTTYKSACSKNVWYLPYNTEFNCFGNGCHHLGQIYSNDVSGLKINLNSCDDCEDKMDCLGSFLLHCGFKGQYNMSDDCNNEQTDTNSADCGCMDLINDINFSEESNDEQCYSPHLSDTVIIIIVCCCIGVICCIIILIVSYKIYSKRKKEKEYNRRSAPIVTTIQTSKPNTSEAINSAIAKEESESSYYPGKYNGDFDPDLYHYHMNLNNPNQAKVNSASKPSQEKPKEIKDKSNNNNVEMSNLKTVNNKNKDVVENKNGTNNDENEADIDAENDKNKIQKQEINANVSAGNKNVTGDNSNYDYSSSFDEDKMIKFFSI